jgi:hypothetical protein
MVIVSITTFQQLQSKRLLKQLSSENLKHSSIRYFQILSSRLAIRGGLSIKAEMYYNEEMIIICPKKNGWFNGLFNINLPIIFTSNENRIWAITRHYSIFKPHKLIFTKWNDLIIEYQNWSLIKVNYIITIEFLNKSEKENPPTFKIINLE